MEVWNLSLVLLALDTILFPPGVLAPFTYVESLQDFSLGPVPFLQVPGLPALSSPRSWALASECQAVQAGKRREVGQHSPNLQLKVAPPSSSLWQ